VQKLYNINIMGKWPWTGSR